MQQNIYIYGPPGSGKSTLGKIIAQRLDMNFIDLDARIEEVAKKTIREIFADEGEPAFRDLEHACLQEAALQTRSVVALGGGALLRSESRKLAERSGRIVFLDASVESLKERVAKAPGVRPLLQEEKMGYQMVAEAPLAKPIDQLMAERSEHYNAFPLRINTSDKPVDECADELQATLGVYYVSGVFEPYCVHVSPGLVDQAGPFVQAGKLGKKCLVIGDNNTLALYGDCLVNSLLSSDITATAFAIPPGEHFKTVDTVQKLWQVMLNTGIERGDTIIALGGGVVGDLAGFAAATWLRGVRWVSMPTTLLAMVDSGVGGKTGADLPEGKNLVGAFHSPSLVLADISTLRTLPVIELRCGLAEIIKHGVIADPALLDMIPRFAFCRKLAPDTLVGDQLETDQQWLSTFIAQAMAVKIRIVMEDPFEQGIRAALNFGHTIGHGIEHATGFQVKHGEAVAIGMVAETRLAEMMQVAPTGTAEKIVTVLHQVGLPTIAPKSAQPAQIMQAMQMDKKKAAGQLHFALPTGFGSGHISIIPDQEFLQLAVSGICG